MRLLVVSTASVNYPRFHRRWAAALKREGHEVHWASEDWGDRRTIEADGVCFHDLPPHGCSRTLSVPWLWRDLRELIVRLDPDVVLSEGTATGLTARFAVPAGCRPARVHIVHSWPWHDLTHKAARRALSWLEKAAATRTDHFVVINREDFDEGKRLRIFDTTTASCMPVGIDADLYEHPPSVVRRRRARERAGIEEEDAIVFLFVGRMVGYKGIFDLTSAFVQVLEHHPHARLVMVGRPHPWPRSRLAYERLVGRIRTPPLAGRVTLLNDEPDLPALYAASDVFVMPSVYEGLGLVYLEAGAMGLPCIGYRVRGVREAIVDGETGLLVPPRSIESLALTMLRLAAEPDLRRRLGDNGRVRWRGRFDNRRFADLVRVRLLAAAQSPGSGPRRSAAVGMDGDSS